MRWVHVRGAAAIVARGGDAPVAGDLWVRGDEVVAVGAQAPPVQPAPGDEIVEIDGRDLLVAPPFIDLHVHFREPGGEAAETIDSGRAAALAGGYGVVYAMANTQPTCDTPELALQTARSADDALPVEVVPISALSRGLRGRELVDLEAMAAAGVGAFSDDGAWLADERLAREAFRWSAREGVPLWQHCEDFAVTGPGVVHACSCSEAHGLPGIPASSEIVAVERDLHLAAEAGAAFHVCHLSTRGALDLVRRARERGAPITAEVTPHHLVLTVEDAVVGGTDFKMKPPLRDPSDVDALVDGLVDGTLGAIATDHAPHTREAKARGWLAAPFGIVGLETAFAVLYTRLVQTGRVTLGRLVEALTAGPAAIARREGPRLVAPGRGARFVLVDLVGRDAVAPDAFRSRSRNTPFTGTALSGWPVALFDGPRTHVLRPRAGERIRTRRCGT
ncbi:MAG: dihydroorotase [Planctomycetota bacterium]